MQLNKYLMPIATILALLGTIFTAKVAGYWQTSGRDMIDPTQPLTSSDIRGWMPLEYLSERMNISHDALCDLIGIPAETPPHTPLKELEDMIEVGQVRMVIAEYLGEAVTEHQQEDKHTEATPIEATPTEATPTEATPTEATPIEATPTPIPATPTPAPAPTKDETEHQPGSGQGTGDGTGPGPTPLPPGQVLPAAEIRGRMTLQEVSEQCGVPLDVLYSELELPENTSSATQLKILKEQIDGFEVSLVRDIVAKYQTE